MEVNLVLEQICKGIFLFFQFECKQCPILFSDGVREEGFYQVNDCLACP